MRTAWERVRIGALAATRDLRRSVSARTRSSLMAARASNLAALKVAMLAGVGWSRIALCAAFLAPTNWATSRLQGSCRG